MNTLRWSDHPGATKVDVQLFSKPMFSIAVLRTEYVCPAKRGFCRRRLPLGRVVPGACLRRNDRQCVWSSSRATATWASMSHFHIRLVKHSAHDTMLGAAPGSRMVGQGQAAKANVRTQSNRPVLDVARQPPFAFWCPWCPKKMRKSDESDDVPGTRIGHDGFCVPRLGPCGPT